MLLEKRRCSYSTATSVGGSVADFSCAAVPMLVPAKEDMRKLAYLFFSGLYKLSLILLLFTPFTIINLI